MDYNKFFHLVDDSIPVLEKFQQVCELNKTLLEEKPTLCVEIFQDLLAYDDHNNETTKQLIYFVETFVFNMEVTTKDDIYDDTFSHIICHFVPKHHDILNMMIDQGKFVTDKKNSIGLTPLDIVSFKSTETVKLLFEKKLFSRDEEIHGMLVSAAKYDNLESFRYLYETCLEDKLFIKLPYRVHCKHLDFTIPLWHAMQYGSNNVAKYILQVTDFDISYCCASQNSFLHMVCTWGNLELLEFYINNLTKQPENKDTTDDDLSCIPVITFWIKKHKLNEQCNSKNVYKETPLYILLRNTKLKIEIIQKIANLLLDNTDAQPHMGCGEKNATPFMYAISSDDHILVDTILQKRKLEKTEETVTYIDECLYIAMSRKNFWVFEILKKYHDTFFSFQNFSSVEYVLSVDMPHQREKEKHNLSVIYKYQ